MAATDMVAAVATEDSADTVGILLMTLSFKNAGASKAVQHAFSSRAVPRTRTTTAPTGHPHMAC